MGGLDKETYSLLSVYVMMTDDNYNIIGDLYLYLKPDGGIYRLCAESMNVNKINIVEHDKRAISYKDGATLLYNWLKKHTDNGKIKATVVGHGVYGDVEWIIHHLISRGSWENFTSYRKLDTSAVCQFLKSCNMFPETVSGSLVSLAKHFNVKVDENLAHDAKYDTHLTYEVFLCLRKLLITDSINEILQSPSNDECNEKITVPLQSLEKIAKTIRGVSESADAVTALLYIDKIVSTTLGIASNADSITKYNWG